MERFMSEEAHTQAEGRMIRVVECCTLPDGFAEDASLTSQTVFAQLTSFPQLLQTTRQLLADALGVAVGVVVVRRGGMVGHMATRLG
jgi:hypothetical protein